MDEIEVHIVQNCIARGVCYFAPHLRYVIERDQKRYKRELDEYIARLAHNIPAK